jgi:hypothetical protein
MSPPAVCDFDRHGDRVAVVLDEEEHRQLLDAGGVERFPELALARGAIAERDVRDFVWLESRFAIGNLWHAAVDDAGFGGAHRLQHLRAGRARARHDVQLRVAPVRRHLASARCRVVPGADGREQHFERCDTELQAQRAIAIVRIEPVVPRRSVKPAAASTASCPAPLIWKKIWLWFLS